jgi:methyl-accepting chemotaxis protein
MSTHAWSIGRRLGAAFAVVGLLVTLVGGYAVLQLRQAAADLDTVVQVNNRKLALTGEMSDQVHVVSRVMRTLILLEQDEAKAAEYQKIEEAREAYRKAEAELAAMPGSPESLALRARIAEAAARARAVNDRVIALAKANRDAEAVALVMAEAIPAGAAWQDALAENVRLQEQASEAASVGVTRDVTQAVWVVAGATGLALVAAVLLGWRITQAITRPVALVRDSALRMAGGDLRQRIDAFARADSRDELQQLVAAMQRLHDSLCDVVGEMDANAGSVATAADQISAGNNDLSRRTEQQAASLQQTAATMDELTSTVRANGESSEKAVELANAARAVAGRGASVMREVVGTMEGIDRSSRQVAEITSVIDGIAFQTNILALNAAVEAARAGEQGRGFAVVAAEVRTLAQRSAAAAKEIKSLIDASVSQVGSGAELVGQAEQTMAEIEQAIGRVNSLIAEVGSATAQQIEGISQVGCSVSQLDQVTQQNAALVEESAAAAETLKQQAHRLAAQVARFQLARAG